SSTVDAGSETTFQVTFNPTTAGSQTAELSIPNNDEDENPYDIALTGTGLLIPKIALEQPAGVPLFRDPVISWGVGLDDQTSVPAGLKSVRAIAAGYRNGAAIKFDGTVVAWGRNSEGQLNGLAGLTNVQSVAFGGGHSVVLKNDGTVVAAGENLDGQPNVPSGLTGVRAIAAGADFTLALKNDGTVVAWGDNTYGQTNLPDGLTGIQAVSAGDWHGLALKSNGVVVAWGDNSQTGQTNIPPGLTNVIAIEAASFTSAALKADGTVVAWGYPLFDPANQIQVPPGLSGVQAVAAGYAQMYALKTNGTIVAWGAEADSGELDVPPGLNDVWAIAAGRESGFALVHSTVVFADQITPTTSAAKTVVIKSVGPGPLSISDVTVLGKNAADFAVDTNGMISNVSANGQTTFQVTFTPTAAGLRETTLRVVSDDPAASPFDVALVGTGVDTLNALQAWRQLYFGITADSGNAANAFDFDGDRLVNILEFAFGQNPILATSAQPPQIELSGGNIFYSFTEPSEVCCIIYGAEWSTTLPANHWKPIADTGTGTHHIFSIPIASQTNIFVRLTVTAL
ncbi:MAG TPA: choice-of-anchor D domain-containing protein, partial [Verrucomicrobiae bacterium]